MTSRKNIKMFDFKGANVAKHWHVAGEVFFISDCLVVYGSIRIEETLIGFKIVPLAHFYTYDDTYV